MPHKDDSQPLETLHDLLGPVEDLHAMRRDLFETVKPSVDAKPHTVPEPNASFGSDAFNRSRLLAPPRQHDQALCLVQVRNYAFEAHTDQLHGRNEAPCWTHLSEVAGLVATCAGSTPRAIALAWLHHSVTDTGITLRDIERQFGASIADGVRCLTHSSNALLSPRIRRQRLRKRLAEGDRDVHTVRLADMAANLACFTRPGAVKPHAEFLEEKRLDIGVLRQGDEGLKKLVIRLWKEASKRATPS